MIKINPTPLTAVPPNENPVLGWEVAGAPNVCVAPPPKRLVPVDGWPKVVV